uniref:Uncharacterized protein n=1 Tax=Anguilla anguilla TaxID=7936 RepID=A0A0E9W1J8_ANGAN
MFKRNPSSVVCSPTGVSTAPWRIYKVA